MNGQKYTFTLLGGDKRQAVIAEKLLRFGHRVKMFGLGENGIGINGAEHPASYEKALVGCDVLLLPLPASRDNISLSFSCVPEKLLLSDILKHAEKNGCRMILGGMLPSEFQRASEQCGILAIDYYRNEGLQKKNALPSAEGALMLAMEQTERTVEGMKALVCGHGRIGACLSRILQRLGVDVTVAVRRDESLCDVMMCGYKAIKTADKDALRQTFCESDVVFNTVPARIFSKEVMSGNGKKPIYIEIASAPYGVELSDARDCSVRVLYAPSLPGKYAPISAGQYIFETVSEILAEHGMDIL